jgi:hypothetical protein
LMLTTPSDAASWQRLELAPIALSARTEVDDLRPRAVEGVTDRPGAYLLYMNGEAYPEGGVFWTRGTGTADLRIGTGGATTLRLLLFSGPEQGSVHLTVEGRSFDVGIKAGAVESFEVPVPAGKWIHLTVTSAHTFRPVDVDPHSTDQRRLGCQVRVKLQ